jgi:hypothetical protein
MYSIRSRYSITVALYREGEPLYVDTVKAYCIGYFSAKPIFRVRVQKCVKRELYSLYGTYVRLTHDDTEASPRRGTGHTSLSRAHVRHVSCV